MARPALILVVLLGSIAWSAVSFSETGGGQAIPNLTGGWERSGALAESFEPIPGHSGGGPITVDPRHPHIVGGTGIQVAWVANLDNPILNAKTKAKLQVIADQEIEGISHIKGEGLCLPSGVPQFLNRRGGAVQIMQTPKQVVIFNPRDNQTRFVYLNVSHSKHPEHTWYGESVGHYEGGDTLVVDTIGQNDKTQTDRFGTPHSDKIHVVERYRVSPDHKKLDVRFTVDDPGAFTMPWSAQVHFGASSARWDEQICAENNRFIGTVSVGGKITKAITIPTALRPDF
jgi:hypothetical protein